MTADVDEGGADEAFPPDGAAIVNLRGLDVVLAARVAAAVGVETRAVNQAVRRNSSKFLQIHAFQCTEEERAALTSQGVISKPGRGGSRALPWVFTIHGLARLATVLDTPAALDATDRMIDLFLDVRRQLAQGITQVTVAQPSRLLPDPAELGGLHALRRKLFAALDKLLDTVVDPATQSTVRDEIGDVSAHAVAHLKEYLKTKGLENEKLHADVALILEKAREVRERTAADIRKMDAETEAQVLKNIEARIGLVDRLLKMANDLEPNALVALLGEFPAAGVLSAPEQKPLQRCIPSPGGHTERS